MASPERFDPYSQFLFAPDKPSGSTAVRPDVLNRLEQAVGQIQDSETFRRYLDVQARFHKYSWGNVALILMQRPDATLVAGYNAWLKMHRYVRKGERGVKIIVPMRRKESEEEAEEETKLFFGTGIVFDLSQTEGEPLPEVEVPVLQDDEGRDLLARLEELAKQEGVSVGWSNEGLPDGAMGVYLPSQRRIVVREATTLQMCKTLAHELAHHFGAMDWSRSENESIAESVAYVVCSHFGLDTGARSFPYVAVWSKEPKVLKRVLTTVQKVSAKIIDRIGGNKKLEETDLLSS